jgi:hypothetical protein
VIDWTPDGTSGVWGIGERHGRQLGPLSAIMDTTGPLTIVIGTQSTGSRQYIERIASNIAQDLFIYFGAEVDIRFDYEIKHSALEGNVICLGMEDENSYVQEVIKSSHLATPFPIQAKEGTITINDSSNMYTYQGDGFGGIYLHPLEQSRLLLIICGTDNKGLERAAKLFPYRTGVGQPDWAVVGPKTGFQGMQGVEAMGYYSNLWGIELAVSYFS